MAEISIHALREESDDIIQRELSKVEISIHALREESDEAAKQYAKRIGISIHALREESDVHVKYLTTVISTFQSTLSVRRATLPSRASVINLYFNPRSP